jgi:hypothetical protein
MNDGIFSDTLTDCHFSRKDSINIENESIVYFHKAEKNNLPWDMTKYTCVILPTFFKSGINSRTGHGVTGVTSQNSMFFVVTAIRISNVT